MKKQVVTLLASIRGCVLTVAANAEMPGFQGLGRLVARREIILLVVRG